MTVLMITPSYPPISGSHVQRMINMVDAMVEQGMDIHIITYEINENHPSYDPELAKRINSKVDVIRVPMGYWHRKAYSTFKTETAEQYNKGVSSGSKIKKKIYSVVNRVKRRAFFPDSMIDWAKPVEKYVKQSGLIEKIKPDFLLSCSEPHSVHLIGYHISKKYKIPQYMDYADPWTYIGNYQAREKTALFKRHLKLEKKIIERAIGVSFSAAGCRDLYVEKFGLPIEKTEVAMSGIEHSLIEYAKSFPRAEKNEKLVMTYGGALQTGVRDPKPFFAAAKGFEDKLDVTIRTDTIAAVKQMLAESGDANCVRIEGYIPFAKYFDEMLTADVIVFFGNSNDVQIPGKIFNCIATGKHILYLKTNGSGEDSVSSMLKSYPRSTIVENKADEIAEALENILQTSDLAPDVNYEDLEIFTDKKQFAKIVDHMRSSVKDSEI